MSSYTPPEQLELRALEEEIFYCEQKAVDFFMANDCNDETAQSLRLYLEALYQEMKNREEQDELD